MSLLGLHSFSKVAYIGLALFCEAIVDILAVGCGGYADLSSGTVGLLTSPNYPGAYPSYTICIWIIQAPPENRVNLTIHNFVGQSLNGSCADYIEIRDGSNESRIVLDRTCTAVANTSFLSSARWMRVLFKSDGITASSGLQASYRPVYAGSIINNYSSPLEECRSFQFECGNKDSCLPRSYLCDGVNDCGCDSNCDEDDCGGTGLDRLVAIGMGISIGFGIFIVIFTVTFVLEQKLKKRTIKLNIKKHMAKNGVNDPFLKPPETIGNNINRY